MSTITTITPVTRKYLYKRSKAQLCQVAYLFDRTSALKPGDYSKDDLVEIVWAIVINKYPLEVPADA